MACFVKGGGGGAVFSSDLTATAGKVVTGFTYMGADTDDDIGSGTMLNRGAVSINLNSTGNYTSYTVTQGYHNGSGKVTVKTLAAQTGVDSGKTAAVAAKLVANYQGWVNGAKVTGSMTNRGAVTQTLNCGGSYTVPVGYHNGSGKVTVKTLAAQTGVDSGKTAAVAAKLVANYQGWVNGAKVTGSMTNRGAITQTLNCGGSYTVPAGYHSGSGKVTVNSLASQTGVDSGKTAVIAAALRSSYQVWVNGQKVTGSLASQAGTTITASTSNQTIASGKYLAGNIVVAGSANLKPENIKKGVVIFGVTGTWEGLS